MKQFHPDVNRNGNDSDSMIRRVIQAYEVANSYAFVETRRKYLID